MILFQAILWMAHKYILGGQDLYGGPKDSGAFNRRNAWLAINNRRTAFFPFIIYFCGTSNHTGF